MKGGREGGGGGRGEHREYSYVTVAKSSFSVTQYAYYREHEY